MRDIALADIDAGDQPLLGKLRDLIEGGIADHEMPAETLRQRRLGLQHPRLVISNNSCADRIDSGGSSHSTTSHRPAKPAFLGYPHLNSSAITTRLVANITAIFRTAQR